MKTILITGGTGFIGSNLVKKLVLENHKVHVIVRNTSNTGLLADIIDKIHLYHFDGDTGSLVKLVASIKPDVIFHLAGLFIVENQAKDVSPLIEANVLLSAQILEAAARAEVKYFINTGTHWQNYNSCDYTPASLYAATKECFETVASYYTHAYQMRMVTLKLIDTYGPFDTRNKIISLFKESIKSGNTLSMSPGNQEMGLVYIDDVIKGYLNALDRILTMNPHEKKTYMLAPPKLYTLREVAATFEDVYGYTLNIKWGKIPYRKCDPMKITLCHENIIEKSEMLDLRQGFEMMQKIEISNK